MKVLSLSDLLDAVQQLRFVGAEPLYAEGVVNGRPVRFTVSAVNAGEDDELLLQLDAVSWEGPPT